MGTFGGNEAVPAVILFNQGIAPDHMRRLVAHHNIAVESYIILTTDEAGNTVTIMGAPEGDDSFPQSIFETALAHAESAQGSHLTVQGIVSMEVRVTKQQLPAIKKEQSVYGVDLNLTPALAVQEFTMRPEAASYPHIQVAPSPLYWSLSQP